nr:gastrula zinc finger protein XlCGF28.1-like [Leptinotarsa decemlineata]
MENTYLNKNVICRTCLESTNDFVSLFESVSIESNEEKLYSIFMKFTSIEVTKSESYPQCICQVCLKKLTESYLFQKKCYQTQEKLQKLFKDSSEKVLKEKGYTVNEPNKELCQENKIKPLDTDHFDHDQQDDFGDNIQEKDDFESINNLRDSDNEDIVEKYVQENTYLYCNECGKNFLSEIQLQSHSRSHFDTEKLRCSICFKKFTRATDVKRHMSIHTGDKPYSCILCHKSFTQSGSLTIHMRKCHKIDKIKNPSRTNGLSHLCSICGKSFRQSSGLTLHLRRHRGDKPYGCQTCEKRFISSSRLNAHKRIHTGERPFSCKFCNKCFSQSTVMKKHLKSHLSENSHKCSYCSKSFTTLYYLNIHKRKHTGERPLKCSICPKSFSDPKNLKEHSVIHTGEKPFLCVLCGKTFRRSHHLKTHMKVHNGGSL